METRVLEHYRKKVVPALMEELKIKNRMQVPALKKIVVSSCLKEASSDIKVLEKAMAEISMITGQKPKMTRAKKSIAAFKIREGLPLGCVVTLRGARMYEFLDRFANVALPRVRDFRGLASNGFDGRGNYTLGVKEQIIFPEINYDKIGKISGMNITFVTSARNDEQSYPLLEKLGLPFRKK